MRGTGSITSDAGVELILNCNWDEPEDFVLPGNTRIVTITARTNGSHVGGILASFSNNEVTDKTWRCEETAPNSTIENATTSEENGTLSILGKDFSGDAANAQWIWVKNTMATHVRCMKTFGKSSK